MGFSDGLYAARDAIRAIDLAPIVVAAMAEKEEK
jgi:hypothetical protein